MAEYESESPEDTMLIAKKFAADLKAGDFISLTGALGAGKTRFTSGIVNFFCADKMGETDRKDYVLSPTYTIMNSYDCNAVINHFDFYRLNGQEELENCGFFDSFSNKTITVAEWADKIPVDYKNYVEGSYYRVNIEIKKDENSDKAADKNKRNIKIDKVF